MTNKSAKPISNMSPKIRKSTSLRIRNPLSALKADVPSKPATTASPSPRKDRSVLLTV